MTSIRFTSPEYNQDGSFSQADFLFEGDEKSGWRIFRNGSLHLELGSGFVAVQSLSCGVCSTDLARKFLPYPLPQITGHEVVGLYHGKPVTVEINASHLSRGIAADCSFCRNHLDTQCPDRITLGIDRLPGGFAPWFLAPENAVIPVPENVSTTAASLTEPFAAALHAVEASGSKEGEIAVLGPRRLGMLVLAALRAYREANSLNYKIHALVRHRELHELSLEMGADSCIDVRDGEENLLNRFDIVFDTTGNPDGLKASLNYSKRAVHLKSTNGQAVLGMDHLTDMVVDEIALVPFRESSFSFTWASEKEKRNNQNIYVHTDIPESEVREWEKKYPAKKFFRMKPEEAASQIQAGLKKSGNFFPEGSLFPRFDLAVAGSLANADQIIRPLAGKEFSILRPRGAVLLSVGDFASDLDRSVCERGIEVHSSRCGSFKRALDLMKNDERLVRSLEKMVTHRYNLDRISEAFTMAADSSKSIKVLIDTAESK